MSDHDAPEHNIGPDPMDKAYAQAEAVLRDDDARAARRARVLAAVARETQTSPPAVSPPPIRHSAWRHGRWLAAAGVAGLGVLLATQVYLPTLNPPRIAPAAPAIPIPSGPENASPGIVTPAPPAVVRPPTPLRRSRAAPPPAAKPASSDFAPAAPPPPQVAEAFRAPPAASPPASSGEVNEVVVTGAKRVAAPASSRASMLSAGSLADRAARLRDAAAADRTAEVAALLAKHVPVDAADGEGETALMKAIQADHPAATALLRRHGASLDLKNHEGASARDMAVSIGDAELNQALDPRP
jgi:hypothetical protein